MEPRAVAHFDVLGRLGSGGMGVVYRAYDRILGREVALKLVRPEHEGDAQARQRFLREARAAAVLSHPGIATVYEAGEAPLRVLGSLAWQYRRLWKVKELMRQGGHEGEAARTLRMDPYKVRAFLGQFPEAYLQEALGAFLEADRKLKGGSGGKPAMVLDRLIMHLCDRPQPSGLKPSPVPPKAGGPVRARTLSNVRTISATRSRS